MACTITDTVGSVSATNAFVPQVGAKVVATPTLTPFFAKIGSTWYEVASASRSATTDNTGTYSIQLPWPSESDPATTRWLITLPDGSKWYGAIPEGISGPLALHDLKQTYGWTLASPSVSTPVYAIQGPPGATGATGAQGATGNAGAPGIEPLNTTLSVDFTTGGVAQVFPTLPTDVTARFASAQQSTVNAYLFQDSAAPLLEANSLNQWNLTSGTPKYRIGTVFSASKKAVLWTAGADALFTNSVSTAHDPGGGAFTVLCAARLKTYHTGGNPFTILSKQASFNAAGYRIAFNSSDQIAVFASDGTNPVTATTVSASGYGRGVYHIFAVTFITTGGANGTGQIKIMTGEETATLDLPAGWSWVGFTSASAATLGSNQYGWHLQGSIAYLCTFKGSILQSEFDSWLTWGKASKMFPNVVYTPSQYAGVGIATINLTDPTNPRIRKHAHYASPLDARYGQWGLACLSGVTNYLPSPESLEAWTADGGLTVTAEAAADIADGYEAVLLNKSAGGSTPSLHANIVGGYSNGPMMFGCWMWTTDSVAHTASIRLVMTGDGAGTFTQTVQLTNTPQWVYLQTNAFTSSAGISGTAYISPVDITNAAATGSCYVCFAQLGFCASTDTLPWSFAPYSVSEGSTRQGSFSCSNVTFGATNGYAAIRAVLNGTSLASQPAYLSSAVGSGLSGIALQPAPTVNKINACFLTPAAAILAGSNVDSWSHEYIVQTGLRQYMMMLWDYAMNKVRVSIRGMAPAGLIDDAMPQSPPAWPTSIASTINIGADMSGFGSSVNTIVEKVEFGAAPSMATPGQMRSYSDHNIGPLTKRILALGDSITGFYDGWHATLGKLAGKNAIVMNAGYSGNYLAGNSITNGDLLQRIPNEVVGKQADDIIVLAGVNDALFGGFTGAQIISHAQSVLTALAATGARIIWCTILPFGFYNNGTNMWTSGIQANVDAYNNWVLSQPTGISKVIDLFSAFKDADGHTMKYQAWLQGKGYTSGNTVGNPNNGNRYICRTTGTSSGSGTGPSGTGTGIVDGSCTWDYVGPGPAYTVDGLHPTCYAQGNGDLTYTKYGGSNAVGTYIFQQLYGSAL